MKKSKLVSYPFKTTKTGVLVNRLAEERHKAALKNIEGLRKITPIRKAAESVVSGTQRTSKVIAGQYAKERSAARRFLGI